MPHPPRDPETGLFMSPEKAGYDDVEMVTFDAGFGVEAANLSGGTGFGSGDTENFEGALLLDYDDIVDRNERLDLLAAVHALVAFINSTETADGTLGVGVEISSSPSLSSVGNLKTAAQDADVDNANIVGLATNDDTIDIIGRPLQAVAHAPFQDSASGVGGAGSAGRDRTTLDSPPGPIAEFHPRDELFLNGQFDVWNVDDAGVHLNVMGQHLYGVVED